MICILETDCDRITKEEAGQTADVELTRPQEETREPVPLLISMPYPCSTFSRVRSVVDSLFMEKNIFAQLAVVVCNTKEEDR